MGEDLREVLDLFSAAAGGWSLGLHRAGYRTVAACEAVDWRRALYAENNPGVILYDDVRTLTADRLRDDLGRLPRYVVGSPPCQDISPANTKGKGVEGARSRLYFEAIRIIGEVRPRWFALENSANLRTRGADDVLAALEAIDYTCWAFVVGAGDVGANHERKRSWLIGCDLEQVADPDGFGRDEGWSRRWSGIDLPVAHDLGDGPGERCRQGWPGRCVGSVAGPEEPACRDASDAQGDGYAARAGNDEGSRREADGNRASDDLSSGGERNTPDPDQAGQADGRMEPGLRQAEIANDGCGAGRCDDGSCVGQVDLCPPDRSRVGGSRADWSLADLAGHIRLDDGLPGWVAGTRVAIGGPKGTSAASLVVEAFGDAVVPQIPEVIGRAIIRTELALQAVLSVKSLAA